MSNFQVLHTVKCNASATKGMEIHDERKLLGNRETYHSNTNENIDGNRTHLNVDLKNNMRANYLSMAEERITASRGGVKPSVTLRDKEGHALTRSVRKDAVWACDTVISASPDFFKGKFKWDKDNTQKSDFQGMNRYFSDCLGFMENRYGRENILGAIIHYDETTPHMHVTWVPIVKDEKSKTGEKLCYKALSGASQLRQLQTDFNEFVRSRGYELERGEIDSKRKHLSQQKEKLNRQIKDTGSKLAAVQRVQKDYEAMTRGSQTVPSLKAKEIQAQNEALRLKNAKLAECLSKAEKQINSLQKTKKEYIDLNKRYNCTERIALDFIDRHSVYEDFLKKNQKAREATAPFERDYQLTCKYGLGMVNYKRKYVSSCNELRNVEQEIADNSKAKGIEKAAIDDISGCNNSLESSRKALDGLKRRLNALSGKLFRGKEKRAIQGKIGGIQDKLKKTADYLYGHYGIKSTSTGDLEKAVQGHAVKLDGLEQKRKNIVAQRTIVSKNCVFYLREYKYMAVKSKSFRKEWQSVIGRYDKGYKPQSRSFAENCDLLKLNIDRLTLSERKDFKGRLINESAGSSPAMEFIKRQEEQMGNIYRNQGLGRTI